MSLFRSIRLAPLFLACAAPLAAQTTPPRSDIVALPQTRTVREVAATPTRYDWLQYNFDPAHSGNDVAENRINPGNVSTLDLLFSVSLPEVADGAPAVATGIETAQGTKDLLFVNTKAGRIVALEAATGAVVWSQQPASGPRYTTSSPAVDPKKAFVYAYGLDGYVHRYVIGSGIETMGEGWPQLATKKPDVEKASSALSFAQAADGRTFLYVANGGYPGDQGDYQGHLTAIDLANGSQRVFNANCSDRTIHFVENGTADNDCVHVRSAIWAQACVVYDAKSDLIFMATGNGDFDAHIGGHDWGDTVFALLPDGSGVSGGPVDSYTPTNFQTLANTDQDLGSTAPAILRGPPGSRFPMLGVQGGKDALLRLLNLDDLSQQGGPGHVAGELQTIGVPQGGGVLTMPAVWTNPQDGKTWVLVVTGSGASGLTLEVDGSGNPSLKPRWLIGRSGFSPIVANGVLYYAGNNQILALDPATGAILWEDNRIGGIHWETPVIANGILYITDESGRLTAYSLNGQLPAAKLRRLYQH
ncbi:MAG TPA: PQQ-binding-like beta-propeller repeat protein [Thermoanaerobaculia bacterium]